MTNFCIRTALGERIKNREDCEHQLTILTMEPLLNRILPRIVACNLLCACLLPFATGAETRDTISPGAGGHTKILTFDNGMTMRIPSTIRRSLAITATTSSFGSNGDVIFEGNVEVNFEGENGEKICVKAERLTISRESSTIEL